MRLLDINILIPLLDQSSQSHSQVTDWFSSISDDGWATCLPTEASAVRILATRPVDGTTIPVVDGLEALEKLRAKPGHSDIRLPAALRKLVHADMDFIRGHRQLSDTIFLRLAEKNNALFSTFDKGIHVWLPKNHKLHDHLETLEF